MRATTANKSKRHKVVSRAQWTKARKALLAKENKLTGERERLAEERRKLVPKGRDEGGQSQFWVRHHDRYEVS